MDAPQLLSFVELLHVLVGDVAKAVQQRAGDTTQQQFTRSRAAIQMIIGLSPRDMIEAMLATHCVMLHAVMTDSVQRTLRGEEDKVRRATRGNLVALNRAFLANLAELAFYRSRPSEARRDAPTGTVGPAAKPAEPAAQPPPVARPASRAERRLALRAQKLAARRRTATAPIPPPAMAQVAAPAVPPEATPGDWSAADTAAPSAEALAGCLANPDAQAALAAGDARGFARALGIEPNEAFLAAAAAPGSPFDQTAQGPWLQEPDAASRKP